MNTTEPNYMDVLFKKYILNEMGQLGEEENRKLNELKLYEAYERPKESWIHTISIVLDFSNTINIAIWHLWIKNSRISERKNIEYTYEQFAEDFIQNYYAEDNKVDVWEDNQLEEAIEIIKKYKQQISAKPKRY